MPRALDRDEMRRPEPAPGPGTGDPRRRGAGEPPSPRLASRLLALFAALCLHAGVAGGLAVLATRPAQRQGDTRAVTLVMLHDPIPTVPPAPAEEPPEAPSPPEQGAAPAPEPESAPEPPPPPPPPVAQPVEPPPVVARPRPARVPPRDRAPKPARSQPDTAAAEQQGAQAVLSISPAPDPGAGGLAPPDRPAAYLSNPKPRYPELARRQRLEGLVLLEVLVSPAGTPERVTVHRSSGHDVLDAGAVEAVQRWRFAPARQGGSAVAARVEVPVRFALVGN